MARHVATLSGEAVEGLPSPCRTCLFWEMGTEPPDPRTIVDHAASDRDLMRKQATVTAAMEDGRPPGRVVEVDGEIAGFALFAAGRDLPTGPNGAPGASRDALVLAMVWVQPQWRRHGLGRLLLRTALRDGIRSGASGVEAYGDRRWRERRCMLPATWLLHEGFEVHREHPRFPLLRVDKRRTARWADSLEQALDEVLGRLPRRSRVPVGGQAPLHQHDNSTGPPC